MNGKQAKALRAVLKKHVELDGWDKGYRDINVKEKVERDLLGNIIHRYTTSTKVLVQSARTNYKFLKSLYKKSKVTK